MSDLRPSGIERDGAAQLLASARARASAALADLSLREGLRLTDRQRSAVSHLLARLVADLEDELRSAAASRLSGPDALLAGLTSAAVAIADPFEIATASPAGLALVPLLLRRAEEHRLARLDPDNPLLVELAGDEDSVLAAEAVSLLVAQSRRLDGFQEPLLLQADLPAELAHALIWSLAASLRRYLIVQHGLAAAEADEAVSAAALSLLTRHDEGAGSDALALRLALRLEEVGRLDDALVARTVRGGLIPLLLASLSLRTGLAPSAAWELIGAREGRGAPLLLRAAGVGRHAAAEILFLLAGREQATLPLLDLYDTHSEAEAARAIALWRLDPAYRDAIARLAA